MKCHYPELLASKNCVRKKQNSSKGTINHVMLIQLILLKWNNSIIYSSCKKKPNSFQSILGVISGYAEVFFDII